MQPQAESSESQVRSEPVDVEPYGLGGWLLLFYVGVMFLKPLMNISGALKRETPLSWAITIGITSLCLFTGYLISQKDVRALAWLRAYFIVELIFAQVFWVNAWLKHSISSAELLNPSSSFGLAVKMSGYVTIWWFYFKYSDRVRNTFGRNI